MSQRALEPALRRNGGLGEGSDGSGGALTSASWTTSWLRNAVYSAFSEVAVLMNNAGTSRRRT
jgi:hypothetical protein